MKPNKPNKSNKTLNPQKTFEALLASKGLKMTKQRQAILDYLLNSDEHLTPEELYRNLNKTDDTLGRATVFRTLHLLEDGGFVNKINLANGRQAYEHQFSKPHHDHMICTQCSAVIEFCNPTIERLQSKITKKFGFAALWHRHEIFGKCKKCQ